MEWQPIITAPERTVVLVADETADTVAVAYHRNDTWLLAPTIEQLEFEPTWWLPAGYKGNPFKAKVPTA